MGSAGRTRTYNQWINSPAHPVRPVPVRGVWCCPVYEFRSVVLSGVVLSGYVRLHIWLQVPGRTHPIDFIPSLPSTHQPGWNSIDSMIGAVSSMTSSKRSSGATTVIASVSTDMPSGRSTR